MPDNTSDGMTPRIVVTDPEDVDLVILALHSFGNLHIALCDDPAHMVEVTERVIALINGLGVSYDSLDDHAAIEENHSRA